MRPLAMSHDDALAIPVQHLLKRPARRCAVDKRQSPFERSAGFVLSQAIKPRQEAPPTPMFAEKMIAECLDQIGDDRSGGGTVKKDNLIHSKRAAEPGLIDIGQPFSRRAIYQRFLEFDLGPAF